MIAAATINVIERRSSYRIVIRRAGPDIQKLSARHLLNKDQLYIRGWLRCRGGVREARGAEFAENG